LKYTFPDYGYKFEVHFEAILKAKLEFGFECEILYVHTSLVFDICKK